MSRIYLKFILLALIFTGIALPQTCLGLYGGDANHPNGLYLQMVGSKKYTGARQNSSPTYITQLGDGSEILWDDIQGLHYVPSSQIGTLLNTELPACIPTPATPPVQPPRPVPYTKTPLALAPNVIAAADFNHDGFPDVVIVTPGTNQVSVYLGKSDGTFQTPIAVTVGNASSKFTALDITDFNNDKKLDLAILDTANNAVYVIYGKGDGTFQSPVTLPVGHSPSAILANDLNGDGNPDIAVASPVDNTVSIITNNGDGTFIPAHPYPVGKNPVSIINQDINGDGVMDLVVADNGSSDLAVLFGNINGGYQTTQFVKTPSPPTYLVSADFNNDGMADVVALAQDANAVMMFINSFGGKLNFTGEYLVPNLTASLSVNDFNSDGNLDLLVPDTDSGSPVILLGRGDGTLNAPPVYALLSGITSIASGDLNGDGKRDLLVTGSSSTTSTLSFLAGIGNGQFQPPVNIPVAGPTSAVAVGDFNHDGRLDIAVSGAQLSILLNQNSTFTQAAQYPALVPAIVADLNKDGNLDIAGPYNGGLGVMLGNGDGTFRTASSYSVGSNPKSAVAADFNHDGSLDIAVLNAGSATDPGGVSILLGNGTGSFRSAAPVAAGFNPRAFAAADVNGDGKPDFIVATATAAGATTYQISVLLGVGDGTFMPSQTLPVPAGETPTTLTLLDLDGDGDLDIVLADCCSDSSTSFYKGNGDGTFQPSVSFYGGNNVQAIAVGDWTGSGRSDLALAYASAAFPALSAVTTLTSHLNNATTILTNTSGASFMPGPLAPDSIVAAFGPNLTTDTATAPGDPSSLPTVLGSTTVTVKDSKGVPRVAQLYFVSPTQINYLVPAGTAIGPATVSVSAPNGVTTAQVNVLATSPGMFTVGGGASLAAGSGVHVRGTQQSAFNIVFVDPTTGLVSPVPITVTPSTDQVYLTLFGTGIRHRTSLDQVTVNIGGVYTPAIYAGPQNQYPGLDQLNIQLPASLAGAGRVPINMTVNAVAANTVYVVIQ